MAGIYDLPGLGAYYQAADRNAAASDRNLRQGLAGLPIMEGLRKRRMLEEMAQLAGGDTTKLMEGYLRNGMVEEAARVAQATDVMRKAKEQDTIRATLAEYAQRRQPTGSQVAASGAPSNPIDVSPIAMGSGASVQAPKQYTSERVAQGRSGAIQGRIAQLNELADLFEGRGLVSQSLEYRKQAAEFAKLLPKFNATTQTVRGMDGRPRIVQINDAGEVLDTGLTPAEKAHFANLGMRIVPLDPFSGSPVGAGMAVEQSPDSRASTGLGYARLGFDRNQASRPTVVGVEGVGPFVVNRDTGTGRRVTDIGTGAPIASVPASDIKDIRALDVMQRLVERGIDEAKKTPSAFSLARGSATLAGTIPESIAGRIDSAQERQARAFIFNNVSSVINERAGAAQSAQELARLRSFLPAETDNAQQVVDKLIGFNEYIKEKRGAYPNAGQPEKTPTQPKIEPRTGKPTMGGEHYLDMFIRNQSGGR